MEKIYFETAADWRKWLETNHSHSGPVWLVYYKKETGQPTMAYEESVQEALCYGWIDGTIKKLDRQRYMRRFTRRRTGSRWSDLNKQRIEQLIRDKRMAPPGLAAVESAKSDGSWNQSARPDLDLSMPEDLTAALRENPTAESFFATLTKSQRRNYIGWIVSAKREVTRQSRIEESVRLLSEKRQLGMK